MSHCKYLYLATCIPSHRQAPVEKLSVAKSTKASTIAYERKKRKSKAYHSAVKQALVKGLSKDEAAEQGRIASAATE